MTLALYYRYRWWLVFFFVQIILVLIVMVEILPARKRCEALRKEDARLTKLILAHQTYKKAGQDTSAPATVSGVEQIAQLNALALASGLVVQSVNVHGVMLHVSLRGEFKRMVLFVRRLEQGMYSFAIGDFAYQAGGSMEIDMVALRDRLVPLNRSDIIREYPVFNSLFCHEGRLIEMTDGAAEKKAQHFSFKLMRMMGYLQQGERRLAVVQLPDGSLIEVFPAMLLGSEGGEVTEVEHDHLTVALGGKQHVLSVL